MFVDQECSEEYGPAGLELRKLQPQLTFRDRPRAPFLIEAVEVVAIEAPPRLNEEFKVLSNGHDILGAFPLPANPEVAEDVARDVGF